MSVGLKYYCWQGLDEQGLPLKGQLLATDKTQASQLLARQKIIPYLLRRDPRRYFITWRAQETIFFQQISAMLAAGLTLTSVMSLLAAGQPSDHWRQLIEQIKQLLLAGTRLSDTLKQWPQIFPPAAVALITAGEATGQLERSCGYAARLQEQQRLLSRQMVQAMRYPFITLCITLCVTALLTALILPEFATVYHSLNAPLPWFTQALMAMTDGIRQFFLPGGILFCLLASLLYRINQRHPEWQLYRQKLLLKTPFLGQLWQAGILTTLFTTLAMTHQSGLTLLQGLSVAQSAVVPKFWKNSLADLSEALQNGMTLSEAMKQHSAFPALCHLMIRPGEEIGQLEQLFRQLADWYQHLCAELSKNLTSAMEPLVMLITGSVVAALVIAIYLPIFNLGHALG